MAATSVNGGRVLALVALIGGSLFFWDSPVLLPFKLLSVMGHETGHAVATWFVGGSVERITVRPEESGECMSRMPEGFFNNVILSSGGYVGAALFSALLLLLTFRFNARRWVLAAAAVWLLVFGILYGRDLFTIGFCVVMAVLFAAGARFLPTLAVGGLNLFIAAFFAVYAAVDLKSDLWNSEVRARSDAAILASVTHVPAIVWAVLWSVLGAVVLLWGMWLAVREKQPVPSVPLAKA